MDEGVRVRTKSIDGERPRLAGLNCQEPEGSAELVLAKLMAGGSLSQPDTSILI
jgi:hypothetical protein